MKDLFHQHRETFFQTLPVLFQVEQRETRDQDPGQSERAEANTEAHKEEQDLQKEIENEIPQYDPERQKEIQACYEKLLSLKTDRFTAGKLEGPDKTGFYRAFLEPTFEFKGDMKLVFEVADKREMEKYGHKNIELTGSEEENKLFILSCEIDGSYGAGCFKGSIEELVKTADTILSRDPEYLPYFDRIVREAQMARSLRKEVDTLGQEIKAREKKIESQIYLVHFSSPDDIKKMVDWLVTYDWDGKLNKEMFQSKKDFKKFTDNVLGYAIEELNRTLGPDSRDPLAKRVIELEKLKNILGTTKDGKMNFEGTESGIQDAKTKIDAWIKGIVQERQEIQNLQEDVSEKYRNGSKFLAEESEREASLRNLFR